ncbi:exo-beta-N-acetylmuramidase NamZ family protein [Tenacibaculum mesophilum]|uniref:exo-beta-N-acetylmuramidase NamZ family protein n=1 Tax=Tenacibaculum mesophilum TaxID=104268 RepID=UPI003F619EA9
MKLTFNYVFLLFLVFSFQFSSCAQQQKKSTTKEVAIQEQPKTIKTGADRTTAYLPLLKNKNIAIVANQTSVLQVLQRAEVAPNIMGSEMVQHHLVDYLHNYDRINVQKVFAPEHGFRGKADAGEAIADGKDVKTGIPIISLYGKNKKPSPGQLNGIDAVVFDIQDVGARFYTYISTLHYVMEACAELGIRVILLDRPNPNGHYIDGPILEPEHKSFVGMHPVPVVYGMTIGEYGQMINGEKWLANGIQCDLTVIPLENYTHQSIYSLPIKPSPNLPNDVSINLYPSLCFFEGTNVSSGRGTDKQFQIYGSPHLEKTDFSFTPQPNEGAKHPKHKEKMCFGEDLSTSESLINLNLSWLVKAYQQSPKKDFFNTFFTKLAGTTKLQEQIEQGLSEEEIKASWQQGLEDFKKVREQYLLYE